MADKLVYPYYGDFSNERGTPYRLHFTRNTNYYEKTKIKQYNLFN